MTFPQKHPDHIVDHMTLPPVFGLYFLWFFTVIFLAVLMFELLISMVDQEHSEHENHLLFLIVTRSTMSDL